jgi:ribonucleotide reductase alpha subunit
MILENGLEIKATDNHKFLTRNNLNNEWRQVIELKVGDVLNLSDNTSLFYKDTTLVEKLFNSHKTQITNDYNMCIVDCENIKHTQILLFAHGVYSSIRGNDLIVARDCIKQVLFSRKTIDFVSKISSIEPCGEEDVYDCTINEIHCFSANGIIAHNCAEISLANHQTCCLAELYLPNIKSYEELISCATYLYRICKHSLTLPCADSKETEQIVHKQMRMGIGVTGYLQSTDEQRGWLKNCYEYLRKFDKDYSNLHGFPLSIKLTTVKPSGSLSILGNCTPGIHPGFSKYYKRRVRIASESPLIALAKSHGYHVEYVQNFDGSLDHSTQIVTFPMSLPDHTVFAENCSAIDQLEWVKKAQTEWSDNSVSVTVYYRKHELPVIKEWLKQNYNTCIKTVSFLLHNDHGFKQAPMEQITKEEYEELARNCRPIQNLEGICFNQKDMDVMENEKECAGGACPRR